jgi:predicted regulator of Ras-like GTPase activity (Roadblock/LC7/MglB family)
VCTPALLASVAEMDAAQALADLAEISSQIETAVLFEADGSVSGATGAGEGAAEGLVRRALELLEGAAAFRSDGGTVTQLEASTRDGSVFVVREGARGIVATTGPQPTVGLVFYDLKSCLRGAEPEKPKRRRRASAPAPEAAPDEA